MLAERRREQAIATGSPSNTAPLVSYTASQSSLTFATTQVGNAAQPQTVTLANTGMSAVETVVAKRGVNTLIPALKAAGAQDILEIPISKIVE